MTCEDAPCCGCCGYQAMLADAQYQEDLYYDGQNDDYDNRSQWDGDEEELDEAEPGPAIYEFFGDYGLAEFYIGYALPLYDDQTLENLPHTETMMERFDTAMIARGWDPIFTPMAH